jgi:hypothetical protein
MGKGAGETVWATAPPVLTVRHMQHYGDLDLLVSSLVKHLKWLQFLDKNFEAGMLEKGYDKDLNEYLGQKSGLGDWLGMRSRDTFLTHAGFYMAAARSLAYISRKVGLEAKGPEQKGMATAKVIQDRIAYLYLKNGMDNFDFPRGKAKHSPGPEMGLFARIVPGEKRCIVLENWFKREGSAWPGDEEKRFLSELSDSDTKYLFDKGELMKTKRRGTLMTWSMWRGFHEGIFAIRYSQKTLSEMGFHHIALRKATGTGMATFEYLLRHNATTMWESWWRSEDLYSRNHPMLGASAEWMTSSVAGVSLHPTTVGGRKALFWPQFPKSATTLEYASAIQGTPVGDFAIAWRFENLPEDKSGYDSAAVTIRIRLLIPPGGGKGILRLPMPVSKATKIHISHKESFPDLDGIRNEANAKCLRRRKKRLGFHWNWEYDRTKKQWYTHKSGKSIGTACESFLFHIVPNYQWTKQVDITHDVFSRKDRELATGFYDIIITNWLLEEEVEGTGRLGDIPQYYDTEFNAGPYCNDEETFDWHIDDATHII